MGAPDTNLRKRGVSGFGAGFGFGSWKGEDALPLRIRFIMMSDYAKSRSNPSNCLSAR